jgi:glycerate dehydrogenase
LSAFKIQKKMKIVVLDGYTLNPGDLSWDSLFNMGEVILYDRTPADKIIERSLGAEVLITNKTPLTEESLNKLPELKYIGVLATGYNVVDISSAKKRNILVTNVPAYSTMSVAQLTFALLLELCHHVQQHSDSVLNGKWAESIDFNYWDYPLTELSGKTLGIIGFGNIGKKVADIAVVFGMKIIAVSRNQTDQSDRKNFSWASLSSVLEQADVLSIHCPLLPETKGLINAESLKRMKRSAFLLNTSRGQVVIEEDLADALNNGIIAGAGLDVLSIEPPSKENPLFKAKNCLITPHIAWATREARVRLMDIAVNNLAAFINGKPVNVVN